MKDSLCLFSRFLFLVEQNSSLQRISALGLPLDFNEPHCAFRGFPGIQELKSGVGHLE